MSEIITYSALAMDRDEPLGNSIDTFLRRALHVKIGNSASESIPVYVTNPISSSEQVVNVFDVTLPIPAATETLIVDYTIPVGKSFYLSRAQFSGENIATYNLYIDSSLAGVFRTMFGTNLTGELVFDTTSGIGLPLTAGQTVALKVVHPRPTSASFDGRILGVLKN